MYDGCVCVLFVAAKPSMYSAGAARSHITFHIQTVLPNANRQKESLLDDILISRSHILLETDDDDDDGSGDEKKIQTEKKKKKTTSQTIRDGAQWCCCRAQWAHAL